MPSKMFFFIVFFLILTVVTSWLVVARPSTVQNTPSPAVVKASRLREHVITLSQKFYPRNYRNFENLEGCVRYIAAHFQKAGARVYIQKFSVDGTDYKNIIAVFGSQPDETDKFRPDNNDYAAIVAAGLARPSLVVGAHYDSCGNTPGADDNASGIAGLIELAYLLGAEKLEEQVELVAYCLEEPPFFRSKHMGSYHHATLLHHHGITPRLMISLEMIGYFSDEDGSQSYPAPLMTLFYPRKGNFIALVSKLSQGGITKKFKELMRGSTDLPVHSLNAPSAVPGVDYSDHMNYWKFGYNAVMVTDTAFCRNLKYHTPGDIAKRLDYQRAAKVVIQVFEGVKGMVRENSNQENR